MGLSTINARLRLWRRRQRSGKPSRSGAALCRPDAFYEWQKIDAKTKQPFAIGMKDGSPYAFAGLWERWRDPATKKPLETYTVVTTEPE
jgi:putative SOS response-associated peptidase YedK